jgi:hypothetical protein
MNRILEYEPDFKGRESSLGSGLYYARLSESETVSLRGSERGSTVWMLEAFDANWFDASPFLEQDFSPSSLYRYYDTAHLFLLEIQCQGTSASPLADLLAAALDHDEQPTWHVLQISPEGERSFLETALQLTVYSNLFAPGIDVRLLEFGPVSKETQARLDRAIDLSAFPDATGSEIEQATIGLNLIDLVWCIVYDVGQGASVGLCDDRGIVRAYFDLGGGVARNAFTFPSALRRFCFSAEPPIILSHWDWDHWSSACRDIRAIQRTWLAPRQSVGPIQVSFMTNIATKGRLLLLPASLTRLEFRQIRVERCTGSNRNNGGISLTLFEKNDCAGAAILLPGDSRYDCVSSFAPNRYLSVVSPHHGAWTNDPSLPTCPHLPVSRLVHSYGENNSYHHPSIVTRHAHDQAGWRDSKLQQQSHDAAVRETAARGISGLGHVLLGWGHFPAPLSFPCGNQCQLRTYQY